MQSLSIWSSGLPSSALDPGDKFSHERYEQRLGSLISWLEEVSWLGAGWVSADGVFREMANTIRWLCEFDLLYFSRLLWNHTTTSGPISGFLHSRLNDSLTGHNGSSLKFSSPSPCPVILFDFSWHQDLPNGPNVFSRLQHSSLWSLRSPPQSLG